MPSAPLLESNVPGYPRRQGKVRDLYDLGDRLVIVATDRISAFDWVLPTPIPDKGRVLTGLTLFWLEKLDVPNHLLSIDLREMGPAFAAQRESLAGRTMLVRKTKVVPIECVARGYLAGSGWKEYRGDQKVCGIPLPLGLRESEQLPEPIFTPATKEKSGHDINISFEEMAARVGSQLAATLRQKTLQLYAKAAEHARSNGIVFADTKLEWGIVSKPQGFEDSPHARRRVFEPQGSEPQGFEDSPLGVGELILIDEVFTPDSSRFWPLDQYRVGMSPPSFDKQFVRDWLESTNWDKNSPPPALPDDIVSKTRGKYVEAYERLTGREFGWR